MKKYLLFFILLTSSTVSIGQIDKSLYCTLNYNSIKETSYYENYTPFNYESALGVSLGVELSYPIINDNFKIISGINFDLFNVKNKQPESIDIDEIPKNWNERFYSIDVPVKVGYAFEEWLYINMGISNNFNIYHSDEFTYGYSKSIRPYTLSLLLGADATINKKYIVGLLYDRNISTFIKHNEEDTYFGFEVIGIRIGYSLK